MKISCVILAAGQASRMGRPKQLLPFGEVSLLEHVLNIAFKIDFSEIRIVLGAHKDLILPIVEKLDVHVSINDNWASGMGSSISCAVKDQPKDVEGLVIMLGDQPFIRASHIEALIDTHQQSRKKIVASMYEEKWGVPAFFHESIFEKLSALKEQEGAGKLIKAHKDELALVKNPDAAIDLDTPEDYEKWKNFSGDSV
ncbi:MAG: nucleotidyltransferase family protein [Bacteroidia bacterium]|nr:nucleotidyltransferase family protein [Bacteroidia bacterium]